MIPDIGVFHPQIVHFAVALLYVGVTFRLVSLLGKPKFIGPAATTLLLLGATAAVFAVKSGEDAHGPAERIPGARDMVEHHEERGKAARNAFLVVAVIELVALALARRKYYKGVVAASAVVGAVGLVILTEAAGHGGDVVYSYAGGVGTRSGSVADVERLLKAGLFYQARQDRAEGRHEDAARLIEEMARRFPGDPEVALLAAESLIRDRQDGTTALARLTRLELPADETRLRLRRGLLMADTYLAMSQPDSARAILIDLQGEFPSNETVRRRLDAVP